LQIEDRGARRIGPAPMAALLLADLGATVLRIERGTRDLGIMRAARSDLVMRGRHSIGST